MDALVELLPLLFIAAYYLLRARQRAAQQREARQPAPQKPLIGEEERAPTPFQRFLREVEEAMAEAAGETRDEPEREVDRPLEVETAPPPSPLPAPPAKPVRPAAPTQRAPAPRLPEFRAPAGSFDAARPTDHERHGFGPQNPLSEESFERRPAQAGAPARPRAAYDPHRLHEPSRPAPGGRTLDGWRRRLADPAAAREAFVLQTIFGERGGRAREARR